MPIPDVDSLLAAEPEADRVAFRERLHRYWPDLEAGLAEAYGSEAPALAERLLALAVEHFAARSADLRLLDLRRTISPDWFQQPSMLGYATYADRFGGTLAGVGEHTDHLAELGVTYLHLLPLLAPRPKPNDGGYAVMDYRAVRPDLGTVDDLRALATTLRGRGISLTLDLVLNHVAAEHEWAVKARAGDPRYRAYFHVFDDRAVPDAYERTLPEVFPDFAPGSFSFDPDLDSWVWTTFNSWQWDLNWHNPDVFAEMAEVVLWLANLGVECLRLDAIAFLWKRLGTDCQNQPEVHALTRALRALARVVAPALLLKAEAIVGPAQLMPYLGTGRHAGKVSDLAYHNSLMVQLWSGLAAGDARLLTSALRRFDGRPLTTSWGTYLRCHDDIGWAVDDADAARAGVSGPGHRAFLSDFYSGEFPGSTARGLVFQANPETGDRRISGSTASLLGLAAAREGDDPVALDLAVRRYLVAHHAILAFGGLPLLWMGDEVALPNDDDWAADPDHADDNRWVHRPRMPWRTVDQRQEPGTVESRVFQSLQHAQRVRAGLPSLHAGLATEPLEPADPAVAGWVRRHPEQVLVALHNLSARPARWSVWALASGTTGEWLDALTGAPPARLDDDLWLEPYQALWLVAPPT